MKVREIDVIVLYDVIAESERKTQRSGSGASLPALSVQKAIEVNFIFIVYNPLPYSTSVTHCVVTMFFFSVLGGFK